MFLPAAKNKTQIFSSARSDIFSGNILKNSNRIWVDKIFSLNNSPINLNLTHDIQIIID
jgi:hypothetical protein